MADGGEGSRLDSPASGVVVTGAASGIGRACARALAAVGRPVAAWDIDESGAAATAKSLADDFGVASHSVALDVQDRAAINAAVAPTVEVLGSVGGLVHAAGIVRPALDGVIDTETWDAVLTVNLRAHGDIVNALLPALRASGPGAAVVGIASIEGLIGHGAIPSYVASKHGLIGLTRSLAHRLGGEGIRANAVCPGYIETPMLMPAIPSEAARASFESKIPLGRLGQPDDIARVVRFLLSDEAAYVNGAAIVVDAGFTAIGGQESMGSE